MLHRPTTRALFAGAVFLSLSTMPGPAPADTYYETIYLPTSSVVSLPTSSLLSTSYVVPTAYSTTYLPTSSVIATDSVIYPTSTTYYRRSILRPRRYVERTSYSLASTSFLSPTSYIVPTSYVAPTSYLPTSYIVPTSYVSSVLSPTSYVIDNGVVTTSATSSSYPCETTSSPGPTRSTANRAPGASNGNGNSIVSEPMNGGGSGERRPSAVLNSTPGGDEGIPAPVGTPPSPKPPGPASNPAELAQPPAFEGTAPAGPQGAGGNPNDKIQIPPAGTIGPQTPPSETSLRRARRPIYDVRNILQGRVISAESKRPEEGVTVIASSLTKNFSDRTALTDAYGEFNLSLPDGDWTVKVKMPSGSIYQVGRDFVTATNGRVTDSSGRNVAEFLITR